MKYTHKWICFSVAMGIAPVQAATSLATQELDSVTVTGTAVPTRVKQSQLDKHNHTDLKQAMKDQIGMSVGGGNGVAQFYSIRGVGEDKIVLNVDNTTQSTKMFHHQSRFQLDPTLLKNLTVEKGTGSASAGIGATAGVIRATTLDAKDLLKDGKNIGFKLGGSYSSNKGWSGNAAAYAYQNGFDFLAAGHYLNNQNYKDGSGSVNLGSKQTQRNYLFKIGYDFNDQHSIRLSHRQEYEEGRRTDKAEFPLKDSTSGYEGTAQRQTTSNLAYSGRDLGFVKKLDVNLFRIYTQDYKPPKQAALSKELEKSTATAVGANVNLDSAILQKHTLKYGVNYRQEKSVPSDKSAWLKVLNLSGTQNERKTDVGAYVEGIWDFAPLTLTTGLRYDHFDFRSASSNANQRKAKDGQLNPSLGVIWDVNPNLALLGTWNQASRSPRLNEGLLANERAGAAVDVDANLKAETARRAELGFKFRKDGLEIDGSIFQQNIKDLIVYQWAGIDNKVGALKSRGKIYNGGELKTKGYELDARYRWGGLKARLGVSYVKPRGSGKAFAHELEESSYYFWNTGRQWLTGLSYQFENPKLEIGWNGRFVQKTPFYLRGALGVKAGYGVHDVYANWQPLHDDSLNINLGVNNVGNKQYYSHSQRGNAGFFERGRELTLGMNYRF